MLFINCLFGIIWASFTGLVSDRISRNESIIAPPSHCGTCQHSLRWWELVPIFSFILLNGKCAHCHSKIGVDLIIIEIMTPLLPICCPFLFDTPYHSIVIWLLFLISYCDLKTFLIPTWALIMLLTIIIINQLVTGNFKFIVIIELLIIYLIILLVNAKWNLIGNGDIDLIFIFATMMPTMLLVKIIWLATVMAIISYYLLFKKRGHQIPFIPCLSIAFIYLYV